MRNEMQTELNSTASGTSKSPFCSLEHFFSVMPLDACIFGIDLGTKTIGIAIVFDIRNGIASPLQTLSRGKFSQTVEELLDLAKEYRVSGFVIGLPVDTRGFHGRSVQSTEGFFRNVSKLTPLPMTCWDERFSTLAVTKTLVDAGVGRLKRAKLVDKMAAAFILQGALDAMRFNNWCQRG